jgi:AcrR family transcriptional regulator
MQRQAGKRPYRRAAETREHVLAVAAHLFYGEGIRAVGIDRLAAEAEVTTTTLYRLFGSKDGLVAAYVRRADALWFDWLEDAVAAGGLAHLFDELDEQARASDYRGCPFRLALAEYPSPESEVNRMVSENKKRTSEHFRELAVAEGIADPDTTAERLMLILDGICASGAERGPGSPAGAGPPLVRELLQGSAAP